MRKYEEENKEGKGRKKEKQKEVRELTLFDFRGLHPQQKAFDGYILTIKFCMNPLKGIYTNQDYNTLTTSRIKNILLALQVKSRLQYLQDYFTCTQSRIRYNE